MSAQERPPHLVEPAEFGPYAGLTEDQIIDLIQPRPIDQTQGIKMPATLPEIAALCAERTDRLWIVALQSRPGVCMFMTTLEHNFFVPSTPREEEFWVWDITWPLNDPLMRWAIVSVPAEDRPLVEAAMSPPLTPPEFQMHLADGIPWAVEADFFGRKGMIHVAVRYDLREKMREAGDTAVTYKFPVEGEHVFTLENHRESGSHDLTGEQRHELLAREVRLCEFYWDRGRKRYVEACRRHGVAPPPGYLL